MIRIQECSRRDVTKDTDLEPTRLPPGSFWETHARCAVEAVERSAGLSLLPEALKANNVKHLCQVRFLSKSSPLYCPYGRVEAIAGVVLSSNLLILA